MPIVFSCAGCKKKYEVGDHLAGKMGRCKQCGSQFRIPVPRTIAAPPAPKAPPGSDLLGDFEEEDTFPEDDDLMGPEPDDHDEALPAAAAFGSQTPSESIKKKKKKKKKSSAGGLPDTLANMPLPMMILGGGGTMLALFLLFVVVPSMRDAEADMAPGADPANGRAQAAPENQAPAAPAPVAANIPAPAPAPAAEAGGAPHVPRPQVNRPRPRPGFPGIRPNDPQPPAGADALTVALYQIKSSERGTVRRGLETLARVAPDKSRKSEVAAAIVPLVIEPDAWTAEAAVKAVANWPTPEGVQALINAVERDDRRGVRRAAMEKLAAMKEISAAPTIASRLKADRFEAKPALIALGPEAESAVLPLLSSSDADERKMACEVLKEIGGQATLDTMKSLPADSDTFVRMSAASAMRTITNRLNAQRPSIGKIR